MLLNKKILLCVTGGIAVYKAADLTSKLVQNGANVKVIMSESATKFVAPLTFSVLSKNNVTIDIFTENTPEVINHIDLADWADLILIAPATANIIGKLSCGIVDNLICATIIASKAPVFFAPAMNVNMLENFAVVQNINTLQVAGYQLIESDSGHLACGYVGKGRLPKPQKIIEKLLSFFKEKERNTLQGKKFLITVGATIEKIDPVRFISNFSTGKMGCAIAEVARNFGAKVVLVAGKVDIALPSGIEIIKVTSAKEMYESVIKNFKQCDCFISTAAVADFSPVFSSQKIKKQSDLVLTLKENKDILKTVSTKKGERILVGFAAETDNIEKYALMKLVNKKLDLLVANDVTKPYAGFGFDTNVVTIYRIDKTSKSLPLMSKKEVAKEIIEEIEQLFMNAGAKN